MGNRVHIEVIAVAMAVAVAAGGCAATPPPTGYVATPPSPGYPGATDLQSDRRAAPAGSTGASTSIVAGGNGAPATVVADGNDDTVVARRIRKAAEQEADPELKGKLWREYVEYKKNTGMR